jgi:MFS family permease
MWLVILADEVGVISYFTVSGWLALTLTGSPFWVGATAGMSGLALAMSSLFAGVIVDRVDKKKLIIAGQMVQMVLSFTIGFLIFTDNIALWHILAMAFLRGIAAAVKITATRTIIMDLVGKSDLLAANAATIAAFTTMGIIMPPVVGIVVERADMGWIYMVMGCAGITAILLLGLLRGVESQKRERRTSPIQDLGAGLRYVITTPIVRSLIVLGLIGEVFGWGHEAMLPVMARDVLDVGPTGLGYLYSAGSVGALLASLILSTRSDITNQSRLMIVGYVGMGAFLILFAWSPWFLLSLFLIAVTHFMGAGSFTLLETMLQTSVPDDMRGRVLSLQSFGFGLSSVTGFQTGAVAVFLGAPVAIAIGASVVLANGLRLLKGVSARFIDLQDTPLAEGDPAD